MTVPGVEVEEMIGGLAEIVDDYDSRTQDDGPMSETEVQHNVGQMIDDAITYQQSELSPQRGKFTDLYMGRPFGDEEEGRSQVVTTEVRDAVQAVMPSLMRIFFGPENVAEFRPREMEDCPVAEQMTDYVNYIIEEDNDGFLSFYSSFKDALVRRIGVMKWWWDESDVTESYQLTEVSDDQLTLLDSDESIITMDVVGQREGVDGIITYDVDVTRTLDDGRVRIMTVPPEEFLYSRAARNKQDALCVAHRQELKRSDLVAMGIPEETIDEHGGPERKLEFTDEAVKRQPNTSSATRAESPDEAGQLYAYCEAYVYLDVDGDGIAEHRRICTIGNSHFVVWNDPWPDRPFACFEMDPEPHTMWGLGLGDRVADLQDIKSHVLRGILDSLSFSLHPRTAVVEGQANIKDVMQTEIGAIIRERQPGMVREFTHTFVGAAAFPVLEYIDEVKQERTGISKASAGLNPDALQSSTKAAVAATVTAREQNLELIARLFAETGMKDLMQGVLRTVVAHQQRARVVRLRNEYVEVDPRPWTIDMDVSTNVALGSGLTEERVAQLMAIAAKQEEILKTLGPSGNPLVTIGQYRNTLGKILELQGYKDTTKFFKPLPDDFEMPPKEPEPTPEQTLAQVENNKTQAKSQSDEADRQLKARESMAKEERERARIEGDFFLRAKELELKYGMKIDEMEMRRFLGVLNAQVQREAYDRNDDQ